MVPRYTPEKSSHKFFLNQVTCLFPQRFRESSAFFLHYPEIKQIMVSSTVRTVLKLLKNPICKLFENSVLPTAP